MNDITQATALLDGLVASAVVGDRAYDSDALLAGIEGRGMAAVIPSRANRKQPRVLDRAVYAMRNVVERYFGRLKAFRRVATRYDKTASSYAAQLALGALLVALSGWMP